MPNVVVDIGVMINEIPEIFDFHVVFFGVIIDFILLHNPKQIINFVNCTY